MLNLPAALQARLDSGVTTLCRCWKLTRRDGVVLGFTDHDRALSFEGVTFEAASGLSASEAENALGLQTGGGEVSGALSSAHISERDILKGLYDDAEVETILVDWQDVSLRVTLEAGSIGEIRRNDRAFVAEVRGPMHRLDEETGRIYQATCAAELGDARCRVGIEQSAFRLAANVAATDGRLSLEVAPAAAYASGWFSAGTIAFMSGANAGRLEPVKDHQGSLIALWQPAPVAIAVGDAIVLTAGCDKRFATCHAKFNNALNFRGFPHIPTPDFVLRYANPGESGNDGGRLTD